MNLIDDIRQDVLFALRGARRSPAFTLTAIVTMALGIAATTAVFSVVNSLLIQPLPYPDPDRIVRVYGAAGQNGSWQSPLSTPNFQELRARPRSLVAFGGSVWNEATVTGVGDPIRVMTSAVYGDFFGVLGTRPFIGRALRPGDTEPGAAPLAVISYDFWKQQLGAPSSLSGRHLTLRGKVYDVVGVMPAGFRYPNRTRIWIGSIYENSQTQRGTYLWSGIARLAPGASVAAARREIDGVAKAIRAEYGDQSGISGAHVIPLGETLVGQLRTPLTILFGAVALVLLISCVNLASAILARVESRRQEFTVRAALGAARGRLIRQIIAESAFVTLVGGAVGCGLAIILTRLLAALGPSATGLSSTIDVSVNIPILLGALGLSCACGMLIGLLPALGASRVDLRNQLAAGSRSVAGNSWRIRRPLVMAEVALALALMVGAGLLVRSLRSLMLGDPGFSAANVVTLDISLPEIRYTDGTRVVQFFDRFLERAAAIPGVEAAGVINTIPYGNGTVGGGIVTDAAPNLKGHAAYYRLVSEGYFAALRIPLVRGRMFDHRDRPGSTPVAVVTQAFADAYWPGENPIGRRVRWVPQFDAHDDWMEVVGVVGNTKDFARDDAAGPAVYVTYAQRPERALEGVTAVLHVRTLNASTVSAIRDVVREIDREIPTTSVSTLTAIMSSSVANRRFTMYVMVGFGAFALFLAALGLYSVLAYAVAQRNREIGVRIALGATQRGILWLVVRDGMTAVVPGILIGVGGAAALTRVMQDMLYRVAPRDPTSFGVATASLLVVAIVSCLIPAARAASTDPASAMRSE